MLVLLIKKDKIYSVSLPIAVNGTYWVSDNDKSGNERKLLSIEEKNGEWSLPGGWMDVNQTIRSNTEKEVKEQQSKALPHKNEKKEGEPSADKQ